MHVAHVCARFFWKDTQETVSGKDNWERRGRWTDFSLTALQYHLNICHLHVLLIRIRYFKAPLGREVSYGGGDGDLRRAVLARGL